MAKHRFDLVIAISLLSVMIAAGAANAKWEENGTEICAVGGSNSAAVSDGAGGFVIVWVDGRNGAYNKDIYAQRVDKFGNALWQINGVAVGTDWGNDDNPAIARYGSDYVIVWELAGGDLGVHRISSLGTPVWTSRQLIVGDTDPQNPQIVVPIAGDPSNMAIIVWLDTDTADHDHLRAQAINANGAPRWSDGGVLLTAPEYTQGKFKAVPIPIAPGDESGGVLVVFEHHYFSPPYWLTAAQRIASDANGTMLYGIHGAQLLGTGFDFDHFVPDVAVGIDEDFYVTSTAQTVSQRAIRVGCFSTLTGASYWRTYAGDPGVVWSYGQHDSHIALAPWPIVIWEEGLYRTGIYAQKFGALGALEWGNGKRIDNTAPWCFPYNCNIVSAAYGAYSDRVIIAWADYNSPLDPQIQAQLLVTSGAGTLKWGTNGYHVTNDVMGSFFNEQRMIGDGAGGAYLSFTCGVDLFASRVIPEIACTVAKTYLRGGQPSGFEGLSGCPKGDMDQLKVNLQFTDPIRDVAAADIVLDKPPYATCGVYFWKVGDIIAGGPANGGNGYATTIVHSNVSGGNVCYSCYGPIDIPVRVQGVIVGKVANVSANSPDLYVTMPNTAVDISDLVVFGSSYNKSYPDPAFNKNCDYDWNNACGLADFSYFGLHFGNRDPNPPGSTPLVDKAPAPKSDVRIRFVAKPNKGGEGTRIRVSLFLENAADIQAMAMGLSHVNPALEFVGFEQSASAGGVLIAAETGNPKQEILIGGFDMGARSGASFEAGTLLFGVKGACAFNAADVPFTMEFCDVMNAAGITATTSDSENSTEAAEPARVHNRSRGQLSEPVQSDDDDQVLDRERFAGEPVHLQRQWSAHPDPCERGSEEQCVLRRLGWQRRQRKVGRKRDLFLPDDCG